jgi:chitinase
MKIVLIAMLLAVALSARVQWFNRGHSEAKKHQLSMFYCGFGGDFCGQSTDNDVNNAASYVILAFVNTNPDGSVSLDEEHYPHSPVQAWRKKNKKVIISVGGQNGNWGYIFASAQHTTNFVHSIQQILTKWELDGIDLDIESYMVTPRTVANMILQLRATIGKEKLLIVSPECVAVYQGVADYSPDVAGQAYNYFVNIIRLADEAIDLYQPQAYNNWYDVAGGSLDYLKDVYLNWRNLPGIMSWMTPIPNFSGVEGDKLMMGILASTSAGGASYYFRPEVIDSFKQWLGEKKYPLRGFMMWDSHWDTLNGRVVSDACVK